MNNIKYLGAYSNQTSERSVQQELQVLKKEIRKYIRKWKDFLCSWIISINTVKTTILPKEMYRFDAIPIKILTQFFTDPDRKIFNFI